MKKNPSPHRRRIMNKKRIPFACILALVITAGITNLYLLHTRAYAQLQQQQAESRREIDTLRHTIEETKARKEAEKREMAEKAAQDAAEVTDASRPAANQTDACNQTGKHNDANSAQVIVNKKHCMQPLTFAPSDLTDVYGATLSAKAAPHFKALYEAAAAANQGFSVTSSYRSYGNQVSTYQYWVAQSGQAVADTYSARPGYSEHQTGLAVDLAAGGCVLDCFGSTSQYQWLQQHAAEYGFIQRYYAGSEAITGYKAEEWHYRYVGREVAMDMRQRGIKTLEELWGIPGGTY